MKNLIIVESPTKARTLSRFLGSDYQIEATMGHVRDLPQDRLGIDMEHDFTPMYQTIVTRKKMIAQLKKLAASAQKVILATDPDREGEAIAWHVANVLKLDTKDDTKVQRIVFHEITKSAILAALSHTRGLDMQLVDAQQARRILDRLVGYKLSPLLWNKIGKRWLSAGRVQSVAVRLIVEREREIQAFVATEYWEIEVELQKQSEEGKLIARLVKVGGEKVEIHDKVQADTLVSNLQTSTYTVTNLETKDVRRFPYPPFTTSTLQQGASNKYGWSAKRTISLAQNLYEDGYITYHRTDSTNISAEAITTIRSHIKQMYGDQYLPNDPKVYKTKSKVAQEAHEAIRPTNVTNDHSVEDEIAQKLGREAVRLYELIKKRFVACQMNEAVMESTGVDIDAVPNGGQPIYSFRANGQRVKFDGWLAVYGTTAITKTQTSQTKDEESTQEKDENRELPQLTRSEVLRFLALSPLQKFTQPPPRYNEASLIKVLEEKGIGRPSTYAPIISTIQDRKYVEKVERKFIPTDLGMVVNDFLVTHFPDVFDISFTAKMEDELDNIANGQMQWIPLIHTFYDPLGSRIETVYKEAQKVKVDFGTTDEKCEKCGSSMVVRMSRFGKFLACSTFPECKFTKNIIEKAGIPCPKCGGDIIVKRTRTGKQFYGCSNYPTCNFAAWKKEEILKNLSQPPAPQTQTQTEHIKTQN